MIYLIAAITLCILNIIIFSLTFRSLIKLRNFYDESLDRKKIIIEEELCKVPNEVKERMQSCMDGTFKRYIYKEVHEYVEEKGFEILKDVFKRITNYHFWGDNADMIKQSIVDILIKEIKKTEIDQKKMR